MNSNARYTTTGWLNSVIDNLSDCYDKNNGIYVIIMACTGCLREEFTLFEQGFFGFLLNKMLLNMTLLLQNFARIQNMSI